MQVKLSILFLLICCYSCAAQKVSPTIDCDESILYEDNIKNDTNKIVFIQGFVFDIRLA